MNRKNILVTLLLIAAIAASFAFPKAKYRGIDILSKLNVPFELNGWKGEDISQKLNLEDARYNFISDIFARLYANAQGQQLLFLILDAGNFHHPRVCFFGSGYLIRELPDQDITVAGKTFKAHALFTQRDKESFVLVYWICINGKIVDWTQQKLIQFWYSLFNKQKAGLMIRLDIPSSEDILSRSHSLWPAYSSLRLQQASPRNSPPIYSADRECPSLARWDIV